MKQSPQASSVGESDEDLAARFLQSRDPHAFANLVRRTQDLAYRVAFGICGSALAEEVVQDTYLKLARPDCRFTSKGPGSFRRWLCAVVSNIARRHLRTETRAIKRSRKAQETFRERDMIPCAEDSTMKDEIRTVLKETLGGLEEDLRLPLVLYYFEGMTQLEVAQMVGVSQTQIARRLEQALELLRKRLSARGLTASAAALPLLLQRPNLLDVPETLRASLEALDLARLAQMTDQTARISKALVVPGFSAATVLIVALVAAAAGSVYFRLLKDPAKANNKPGALGPAGRTNAEGVGSSGDYRWDFDTGIGQEFHEIVSRPMGLPNYPMPEYRPGQGVNGGGALCFAAQGSSLQLPVVIPTGKILPLYLVFEIKALNTKTAQFGTLTVDGSGFTPGSLSGAPTSLQVGTWHTDTWVQWVRRITPREDGKLLIDQHYGDQPVGMVGLADSSLFTRPGGKLYFELHGTDVLIDNVRLLYGPDAEAKFVPEGTASEAKK